MGDDISDALSWVVFIRNKDLILKADASSDADEQKSFNSESIEMFTDCMKVIHRTKCCRPTNWIEKVQYVSLEQERH